MAKVTQNLALMNPVHRCQGQVLRKMPSCRPWFGHQVLTIWVKICFAQRWRRWLVSGSHSAMYWRVAVLLPLTTMLKRSVPIFFFPPFFPSPCPPCPFFVCVKYGRVIANDIKRKISISLCVCMHMCVHALLYVRCFVVGVVVVCVWMHVYMQVKTLNRSFQNWSAL